MVGRVTGSVYGRALNHLGLNRTQLGLVTVYRCAQDLLSHVCQSSRIPETG
jgi:hypothetical protein